MKETERACNIFYVPTKEREGKVRRVLALRQPDLRVVLEDITNIHNASAIIRTCDAAGVLYIEVVSSNKEPFPVNEAISTRAEKWVEIRCHSSIEECLVELKKEGFKIVSTCISEESLPFTSLNYTQPIAIVFGNESEGVSPAALELADYRIKIPMFGMVQSLNLSVSAGIILYEALKQRWEKGFFEKSRLSRVEFKNLYKKWLKLP